MARPDEESASPFRCVLDIRASLGECPVWSAAEQVLYWVDINAPSLNRFDPASPFGGVRESGFGREGGRQGLLEYLSPEAAA